jgi:hypothetical protein
VTTEAPPPESPQTPEVEVPVAAAPRSVWKRLRAPALGLGVLLLLTLPFGLPKPLEHVTLHAEAQPYHDALRDQNPDIVLLGNSMIRYGLDEDDLSRRLGLRCYKFWARGSMSAWWYIALKNAIARAPKPPRRVVIFFWKDILTSPGFHVTGPHGDQIDYFAEVHEPLLDELAYDQHLGPIPRVLTHSWSVYQKREEAKRSVEQGVKGLVARVHGLVSPEEAIARVFANEHMDLALLHQDASLDEGEQRSYALERRAALDPARYDFEARVTQSFLPHIVEVARSANIQLVFVWLPVSNGNILAPPARAYRGQLAGWLEERHIPLINFSDDGRRFPNTLFYVDQNGVRAPSYHLGPDGKALLTRLLAEALRKELKIP